MDGCPHCANLESMISAAPDIAAHCNIQSGNCPCYPCAVLCDGTTVNSCSPNDENTVFAAIKSSLSAGTATSTAAKPAATTTAKPATAAATPAWKTTKWANELSIDWGARNPKPTIAETPAGYEQPDISLTPVTPIPPAVAQGVMIALRDHKKPIARKVA